MPRPGYRSLVRRILLGVLLATAFLFGISMTAKRPDNLGVTAGRLADCPDSPNCVSSQAVSREQRMPPIPFTGTVEDARQKLRQVIRKKFKKARLIDEDSNYLRFEFTSRVFRFVDDVEFLVDDEAKLIHFRSASRVGYSDLGANRRRMNTIRQEMSP